MDGVKKERVADVVAWDPKIVQDHLGDHAKIDYDHGFVGIETTAQARYTLSRGDVIWEHGKKTEPPAGRDRFIQRLACPAANNVLSTWIELKAPRQAKRDPQNIPSGI